MEPKNISDVPEQIVINSQQVMFSGKYILV